MMNTITRLWAEGKRCLDKSSRRAEIRRLRDEAHRLYAEAERLRVEGLWAENWEQCFRLRAESGRLFAEANRLRDEAHRLRAGKQVLSDGP